MQIVSFVGTDVGAFVDEAAAKAKGVLVVNTPGVMASAVAEHTVGLVVGLARGLFAQNEMVKRSGPLKGPTRELAGMAIGIVGMGAIGTRVARILTTAFGCIVCYTSRTRKPTIETELGMRFLDTDELFATSEAVVLLAATTPETTGIVNGSRLSRARAGLLLVNTASATLVDPAALKRALETGRVASAAFDGYWIEPLPAPSSDPFGLLSLPDHLFVVTPHNAARTVGTWNRMIALAVDNIFRAVEQRGWL